MEPSTTGPAFSASELTPKAGVPVIDLDRYWTPIDPAAPAAPSGAPAREWAAADFRRAAEDWIRHRAEQVRSRPPVRPRRPPLLRRPRLTWWGEGRSALLIAVLAGLTCFLRVPDPARLTLWAEDGRVFLAERVAWGPWDSLFLPYDGYLHLVPRIIADVLVPDVPLTDYATAVTVASAVVAGLVAGLVYLGSAAVLPWRPARVVLASLVALAPTGPLEVLGNTANLHWLLLWATPWLFVARLRSWTLSVAAGLLALLIALTEIQMLLFAPLLLLNRREAKRLPVALGAVAGTVAQVVASVAAPRSAKPGDVPSVAAMFDGFLRNPVLGTVLGVNRRGEVVLWDTGLLLPGVLLGAFVVAALYGLVLGSPRQRLLVAMLTLAAPALWAAAAVVNRLNLYQFLEIEFVFTRYTYVVSILLLSLLVVAAAIAHGQRRISARILGWGLLATVAVVTVVNIVPGPGRRADGPFWGPGVEQAALACPWSLTGSAEVMVAPDNRRWAALLPCTVLQKP